jgi:ketosteroid isomerase-like protein
MGAFGGYNRGWDDIAKRLDWAAAQYRDGVYDHLEVLDEVVGTDLAYLVWKEQISSTGVDGQMLVRRRRGTQIHRRESSQWRIIHQHSDPLVEVQAP